MKIYTKKGDQGETGLLGGTRVPKYDMRIEAYGTVDELNSHLGILGDMGASQSMLPLIRNIQHQLFNIGSHLANDPENSKFSLPEIPTDAVEVLENSIDKMNESLPDLANFILPGGHPANSRAHVARCVCRRAERRVVELHAHAEVSTIILTYLNRLSDWLFVFSRWLSHETGSEEIPWKPNSH